jgi:Co/Zn/Cd efflux system component
MALRVYVPCFSVIALIAVTVWLGWESILRLAWPDDDDDEVDITMLYLFASLNLAIDLVSAWLFYLRRGDVFMEINGGRRDRIDSVASIIRAADEAITQSATNRSNAASSLLSESLSDKLLPSDDSDQQANQNGEQNEDAPKQTNINMVSAFVHMFGDTMRTLAALGAALVSSIGNIEGADCDAVACIVVTVTIIAMVIPLIHEIRKAYNKECEEEVVISGN